MRTDSPQTRQHSPFPARQASEEMWKASELCPNDDGYAKCTHAIDYCNCNVSIVQGVSKILHIQEEHSHTSNAPSPHIAALVPANTKQLAEFSPEANRWVGEASFVCVDSRPFPFEIDFVRLVPLGLVHKLPDKEERWDEELHGVVGEEV